MLHQAFPEESVFRIDHFLGKEPVENLLVFRFANSMLEPIWNRNFIAQHPDHDGRGVRRAGPGKFYDSVGAMRDVVQNHLLEIVALLAMEPPSAASAAALHDEKVKLFRQIDAFNPNTTSRGQYRGYREEDGVEPSSDTETFVAAPSRSSRGAGPACRGSSAPARRCPSPPPRRSSSSRRRRGCCSPRSAPGARAELPALPPRRRTTASCCTCRPRRRATSWRRGPSTSRCRTTRCSAAAPRPTSGCSRTRWRATRAASAEPTRSKSSGASSTRSSPTRRRRTSTTRARGARPMRTAWPPTSAAGASRSPPATPRTSRWLPTGCWPSSPTTRSRSSSLGPLELRTFGLMVGLGVLLGAWVAARYIEEHTGVVRDETYRLATRLVVGGVIGARITWDLSHIEPDPLAARPHRGVEGRPAVLGRVHRRGAHRLPDVPPVDARGAAGRTSTATRTGSRSAWRSVASAARRSVSTSASVELLPRGALRRRLGPGGHARPEPPAARRRHVPQHRHLRAHLPARAVRDPRCCSGASPRRARSSASSASTTARSRAVRLPAGQRQHGARAHRRPVDVRRVDPDGHLDPHQGPQGDRGAEAREVPARPTTLDTGEHPTSTTNDVRSPTSRTS